MVELCDLDYARLRSRQQASPFESLFSGSPFGRKWLLALVVVGALA